MENNTFQFKTNINCGGCVAAVRPYLETAEGIRHWEVDTANKDKILTVVADGATRDDVVTIVQKAGYKIEPLNK